MASTRLAQLYRTVIMDEAKHPQHHGQLAQFDHEVTVHNPSCGDTLTLQLQLVGDRVADVGFFGSGCTISQASASLMTAQILGKTPAEIETMVTTFSDLIIDGQVASEAILGDAAILKGVHQFPARIKCATLAWKAAAQALTNGETKHD